jgi:hypothetical protein
MKRLLLISVTVILLILIFYWQKFVKHEELLQSNLIDVCISNESLVFSTQEGMKYFDDVESELSNDTLRIKVYTTTVFNIFSEKRITQKIKLGTAVHYVKLCGKVTSLQEFRDCGQ